PHCRPVDSIGRTPGIAAYTPTLRRPSPYLCDSRHSHSPRGKVDHLGFCCGRSHPYWDRLPVARSAAALRRLSPSYHRGVSGHLLPAPALTFLFNERFSTYLAVIGCMGVVLFAARRHSASLGELEVNALGVLAVAINVYALIALSLEL